MKALIARYPLLKPTFFGALGALALPTALGLAALALIPAAQSPAFPKVEAFSFFLTALLLLPLWIVLLTAVFFIVWSSLQMSKALCFRNLHILGLIVCASIAILAGSGVATRGESLLYGGSAFALCLIAHILGTGAARRSLGKPGLIGGDAWSTAPIFPRA